MADNGSHTPTSAPPTLQLRRSNTEGRNSVNLPRLARRSTQERIHDILDVSLGSPDPTLVPVPIFPTEPAKHPPSVFLGGGPPAQQIICPHESHLRHLSVVLMLMLRPLFTDSPRARRNHVVRAVLAADAAPPGDAVSTAAGCPAGPRRQCRRRPRHSDEGPKLE